MDDWAYRIVDIAEGFAGASACDSEPLLRLLHDVLRTSPACVSETLGQPCRRDEVDRLIAAGALIDLAYRLVGRAGLLIVRFPTGDAQATIAAPGLFDEQSHANASVPLAVGGALVAGLVAWSNSVRISSCTITELN